MDQVKDKIPSNLLVIGYGSGMKPQTSKTSLLCEDTEQKEKTLKKHWFDAFENPIMDLMVVTHDNLEFHEENLKNNKEDYICRCLRGSNLKTCLEIRSFTTIFTKKILP